MRTLAPVFQPVLRFRRWCRKGYAVFCSLGKCVTIGTLSKGIADRSLGKQALHATDASVCCHPASGEEEWLDDEASGDVLSVSPMATAPWLMALPLVLSGMACVLSADGSSESSEGGEPVWAAPVASLSPLAWKLAVMAVDGTLAGTVGSDDVYFLFKLIKDREDAVSACSRFFYVPK